MRSGVELGRKDRWIICGQLADLILADIGRRSPPLGGLVPKQGDSLRMGIALGAFVHDRNDPIGDEG